MFVGCTGLGSGADFLVEGSASFKNLRNTAMLPEWERSYQDFAAPGGEHDRFLEALGRQEDEDVATISKVVPELDTAKVASLLRARGGDLREAVGDALAVGTAQGAKL